MKSDHRGTKAKHMEYGVSAIDQNRGWKGEGMDTWMPMKDKDDKHNFKTITENDKQDIQHCRKLITVTIEKHSIYVRDATNKSR